MFSEILESRIAMPGKWETRPFNAKHALYSAFLTISLCAFFFIFNWIQVNLFLYICNTKCILFVVNTPRLAHNDTHSRVLLFSALFLVQFSLFFVTFTQEFANVNTLFHFHYAICRVNIAKEDSIDLDVSLLFLSPNWCIYRSYGLYNLIYL